MLIHHLYSLYGSLVSFFLIGCDWMITFVI